MISIKSLLFGLTASLPLSLASNVFAAAMRLCPVGHGSLHDGGMGDGMVQYDLYARLLGLGNSGPCISHHTASLSHKD